MASSAASGQQPTAPQPVRIAVVEGDSAPPSRTGAIAASVRSRLQLFTARDDLAVVPRKDVVDTCDSGCPDQWTPEWLRTMAQLVGADVLAELTTSEQGGEITAQAVAYRPRSLAADTIRARGATSADVANHLADRLHEMLYRLREERAGRVPAAVRVVSMPVGNYLLEITRGWSRHSRLGDLRRRTTAAGDVEVRAWGGYGIGGTGGVVLRRQGGVWQAWRADAVRCQLSVATSIIDTTSAATQAAYAELSWRICKGSVGDVSRGAKVFTTESATLVPLPVNGAAIDSAWSAAVREGLLTLPPSVSRAGRMLDGFTYVIEVRQGADYRASVIEDVEPPEAPADTQARRVFQELMRIVPRSRMGI